MRVAWELARRGHLVRGARLAPFVPAVVTVLILLVVRRDGTPDPLGDLRLLGLLLALGSGYVLDDGAAVTLQASPYGLARRLLLRVALAVAVVAPLWSLMLVYLGPSSVGFGVSVELGAGLVLGWAVAVWGRRFGVDQPGLATSPALLAALLLAASLSAKAPMLVGPGPQWTDAHLRWSCLLAGAACVLVAGLRDPAARRRLTARV
ncbi:hypothetical protein ACQP00_37865 [Dactylosporangium sp. CS-047395]|uniref:hypothetical protein n=1 Tax=Dactylosporangium sp. CS-047395 TaxID=3239936 RepID=UPI003D8F1853